MILFFKSNNDPALDENGVKAGLELIVLDHDQCPFAFSRASLQHMTYEQRGLIHIVDWNALKPEILNRKLPLYGLVVVVYWLPKTYVLLLINTMSTEKML